MYHSGQAGTDQDKHIRYVTSRRVAEARGSTEHEKSVGRSVGLVSGVRWRYPFHHDALLLFFFSWRAGIGTAGELTLLFGFAAEAVATSAFPLVLLFAGGGGGGGDPLSSPSSSSSSSSSEFPAAPSSSPSDLSDRLVSVGESLDSEGFRASLVP